MSRESECIPLRYAFVAFLIVVWVMGTGALKRRCRLRAWTSFTLSRSDVNWPVICDSMLITANGTIYHSANANRFMCVGV